MIRKQTGIFNCIKQFCKCSSHFLIEMCTIQNAFVKLELVSGKFVPFNDQQRHSSKIIFDAVAHLFQNGMLLSSCFQFQDPLKCSREMVSLKSKVLKFITKRKYHRQLWNIPNTELGVQMMSNDLLSLDDRIFLYTRHSEKSIRNIFL